MIAIEGVPVEAVEPLCPHFGACGGCQIQNVAYEDQLSVKRSRLESLMAAAGLVELPPVKVHSGAPWGYRNRVRLRLARVDGALRVGYNRSNTTEFLPITTCPIAAPALWDCAESLLTAAASDSDTAEWLDAASAVEIFCNDKEELRITLHCPSRGVVPKANFAQVVDGLQQLQPALVSAAAYRVDQRTSQLLKPLFEVGSAGLTYRVAGETYWIQHGGFFQVNRFLVDELVTLVCADRGGSLAWDLFAGVGLFSKVLAKTFDQVIAVEFDGTAVSALTSGLAKAGAHHRAVQASTLDFLRAAAVQRERPELIVLDPPRAGAGVEACELLLRLAPTTTVYVSCDPTTLARDLSVLQASYSIVALHLVDLFPQTSHQETVVVLQRKS